MRRLSHALQRCKSTDKVQSSAGRQVSLCDYMLVTAFLMHWTLQVKVYRKRLAEPSRTCYHTTAQDCRHLQFQSTDRASSRCVGNSSLRRATFSPASTS